MPKLDLTKVPVKTGSIYPEPYAAMMAGRSSLRLGEAGGLTQFGVNLVTLHPGALSSLRHWHLHEDEFVMVTQGQCVMVQDGGETLMQVGDCAAFPAGMADGHHFINRSDKPFTFLVMMMPGGLDTFFERIGRPRKEGDPAPEPFARPADVNKIEQETVFGWVDKSFD